MLAQFSGQVFLDNYSTLVFDRIFYKGAGFIINFYDGVVVLFSVTACMLLIDRLGRKAIFLSGGLCQLIFIWGITFSLYMKFDVCTVLFSVCYTFFSNYASSVMFVYLSEICEPFVAGVAISGLWLSRTLVNIFLPYTFIWAEIYWSPATLCMISTVFFI